MSTVPGKSVLITGANAGIGKEVARQLALRPEIARIYLACRNQARATTAKAELEAVTGQQIFDIILMDVADLGSVRAGISAIDGSVDGVEAGADRIQIRDVHENDVKDVPPGHGFEIGLCRYRPISVSARQVNARDLRT